MVLRQATPRLPDVSRDIYNESAQTSQPAKRKSDNVRKQLYAVISPMQSHAPANHQPLLQTSGTNETISRNKRSEDFRLPCIKGSPDVGVSSAAVPAAEAGAKRRLQRGTCVELASLCSHHAAFVAPPVPDRASSGSMAYRMGLATAVLLLRLALLLVVLPLCMRARRLLAALHQSQALQSAAVCYCWIMTSAGDPRRDSSTCSPKYYVEELLQLLLLLLNKSRITAIPSTRVRPRATTLPLKFCRKIRCFPACRYSHS